jgi:8-oxo-dGTP pyrophosphatase MutT (NUDIX family)
MDKYWKKLNTHREYKDKVLSVDHCEYYFDKKNASMSFTVINTSNWVTIIPVTTDNKFILVKQFRVGTEETTYEFPGGAINENESHKEAALRELREETGLAAGNIELLSVIHPNPAFMSNRAYIYLAEECSFKYELQLDLFEDIEVVSLSRQELEDYIVSGKITHSIVLAAYSHFLLKEKNQG